MSAVVRYVRVAGSVPGGNCVYYTLYTMITQIPQTTVLSRHLPITYVSRCNVVNFDLVNFKCSAVTVLVIKIFSFVMITLTSFMITNKLLVPYLVSKCCVIRVRPLTSVSCRYL